MKIAVLAPFEEAVPPIKYGGTELVAYNLIEQLVKRGHEVTLLATGDSRTSARLEAVFPTSIRVLPIAQDSSGREALKYLGVGRVLSYLSRHEFDIIHNHIGWRVLAFKDLIHQPMVTTLHSPLSIPYQQEIFRQVKDANYITISLAQRTPMPELNFVANVYNGLEVAKFPFTPVAEAKDPYFAFLARMSPEKGPLQAIDIAKRAGLKLVMATKVDTVDKEFYEKQVKPLIDGKQIVHIGEIGMDTKAQFLGNARALLAPIQWEEPFGLFFAESMLCGTPVITMKRGSAPEVVKDGVGGFVCADSDEAVQKVAQIDQIDRSACRDYAESHFSSEKMADGYLAAYEQAIAQK